MHTFRLCLVLLLAGLLSTGCTSQPDSTPDAMYDQDAHSTPSNESATASFASNESAARHSAPSTHLRFRQYVEQHERAYSFEAPEGWNVNPRVLRLSPTAYRIWDVVSSPDGAIRIVGGMPERFLFVEPSQLTQSVGLGEGATMDGITYVARYQDAFTFGRQHLHAITTGCPNVQITGQQERPDEAERQQARAQREGDWRPGTRIHAAEFTFTCQGPDGTVDGRAIVSTFQMQSPNGLVWTGGLRGYLAPPERAEQAYQVMEHMVRSFRSNPQWKAQQRQAQQAQARSNQQMHQQWMAQSQAAHQQRMAQRQAAFNAHQQRMAGQQAAFDSYNQSWQNQQTANDRAHDQFIGSIRDETRVWDTQTGQSYDVSNNADNYYIDNTGSTIVGTPNHLDNPDPTQYNQMYQGYDYEDRYNQ